MSETVKATYALQPETVEDLDKLGDVYRWSRAKTIDGLIAHYVRVQRAAECAQVKLNGIEWERQKRVEAFLEGDGDTPHREFIDWEAESARAAVLKELLAELKAGLVPVAYYGALNAGKSLIENEARRDAERKGKG